MVELPELINELKSLRKGRGLFVSRIDERIGSELRTVCDVAEDDGPAQIRQKVARRIEKLASTLPADLRVAALAAFAISPEAQLPLYQDRIRWAAAQLRRDPRTARRRVDEAIHQIAQLASMPSTPRPAECLAPTTGWHTSALRVMLALDRPSPEAIEHRTIISDQSGLTELDLALTLNSPNRLPDPRPNALTINVFHGGLLANRGMESSDRLGFALLLPKPLATGESHDFVLQYRFTDPRLIRPHVACVPKHPCALFDLRIRFDRAHPPEHIWLLRHTFQRDLDDPTPAGEPLIPDPAGEVHTTFQQLTPGLAYGIRWQWG